jgi:hypothetical protein
MSTTTRTQLAAVVFIGGLFAARAYYQWLLGSKHLHSFGFAGYWSLLALPAVAIFLLLCLVTLSNRNRALGGVLIGMLLAAALAAFLGFFGDFLVCAFFTRGTCE